MAEVRTVKVAAVVIADCFAQVRFLCSFVDLNFTVPYQTYVARQAIAVVKIDGVVATLPHAIDEHEHFSSVNHWSSDPWRSITNLGCCCNRRTLIRRLRPLAILLLQHPCVGLIGLKSLGFGNVGSVSFGGTGFGTGCRRSTLRRGSLRCRPRPRRTLPRHPFLRLHRATQQTLGNRHHLR